MDRKKFWAIAGKDLPNNIIQAIDSSELVSSTLTIHLICEKLIEAWICRQCGKHNFFYDGNERIIVDFYHKLKIAKSLGLPKPIYEVFKQINIIRNNIAHTGGVNSIDQKHFESIESQLNKLIVDDQDAKVEKHYIEIADKHTGEKRRYTFKGEDSTDKIKLLLVFHILLSKLANIVNYPK